jgi:hypothetical protein
VSRVWCLWVDVDDADALKRLRRFEPQPGIVIQTSTKDHVHAIWALRDPIACKTAWLANAQLAAVLHSDLGVAAPFMGLRVPGTLNFKCDPALAVSATRLRPDVYDLEAVLSMAPELTNAAVAGCPPGPARDLVRQLLDESA